MREEAMSGIIIPVCLLLAVAGVALGLVLRLSIPVPSPEAAFLSRVEWWRNHAEILGRGR
jgi:hypothetical protein